MTEKAAQTAETRLRRRHAVTAGVASGALTVGLIAGFGSALAQADPAQPTAPATPTSTAAAPGAAAAAPAGQDGQASAPGQMTADEALAIIDRDYDTGAGGGQLSNLIHAVLKLRAQGYRASEANRVAIEDALNYRPNQTPLINALKETLAYQQKMKQRAESAPSNPVTVGINQLPPGTVPDPTNPGNGAGIFIGGG
jgi:hypothetical protein